MDPITTIVEMLLEVHYPLDTMTGKVRMVLLENAVKTAEVEAFGIRVSECPCAYHLGSINCYQIQSLTMEMIEVKAYGEMVMTEHDVEMDSGDIETFERPAFDLEEEPVGSCMNRCY